MTPSDRQLGCIIGRRSGRSPTEPERLDSLAAQAWHRGADLVTLRLSRIGNDWTRQEIINEANRQHGKRRQGR